MMSRGITGRSGALHQAGDRPVRVGHLRRPSADSDECRGPGSGRITFVDQCALREGARPSHEPRRGLHFVHAVPEIAFDLGRMGKANATVTGRACRTVAEHCRESNQHGREVGGLLIGHVCSQKARGEPERGCEYDLIVTNAIPICTFDNSSVHLNFTEEAWDRAEERIRLSHSADGKTKLGWYHTHPHQGIFFSAKDSAAHQVFAEPYQFALVVDPRGMEAGLFHWISNPEKHVAGPICFSLTRRGR